MANDLVFNMIANSSQFAAGMKQAQKAADSLFLATRTGAERMQIEMGNINQLAKKGLIDPDTWFRAKKQIEDHYNDIAKMSVRPLAGGVGNRSMVIQQLAFAAEDAATQFGTRGLAGALMAAGNNLTFAASMASPLTGVLASVGMTAAMLGMTYFNMGNKAKEAAEKVKSLKEASEALVNIFSKRREFVDSIGGMENPQLKSRRQELTGENADRIKAANAAKVETIRAQRNLIEEENRLREELAAPFETTIMAGHSSIRVMVNRSQEEIDHAVKSNKELNALKQKYIDSLTEESRIKAEIGVTDSRIKEINEQIAANNKKANEQIKIDREAANADLEWQNYSKMWDEAQGMIEKLKTSEDRYVETLTRINVLKREGLITDEEELKLKNRLNAPSGDVLGGAMDIKSAQAGGLVAETYAKMSLMQQMKVAQATEINAKKTSTPEDQKEKYKQEELLKKILEAMKASGKQFSLEVVGLN